jgi:hypothetical protein
MATSKAPFPDPALEIGIPQYPTPNVPDFYAKNGHIILVEKLSAEKGSYNPQPLDGSITYNKRDANKWPSPLYLVYQRPDETGKFVYNYYANDRTLASQDPWNFGLDYSSNDPAFPIATRTYIVPRSQYATVALGSVDPVFGGAMKIASQKKEELPDGNPLRSRYVAVQRVYETIPGPIVSGSVMQEFGLATQVKQVVLSGTAIATPSANTISSSVNPIDSVKSELSNVTYSSVEQLNGYQYDPDLNLIISTTKELIAEDSAPLGITTGLLAYKDEPISAWQTVRIVSRINSLPPTRYEYKSGSYSSPNLVTGFTTEVTQLPSYELNVSVTPIMRARRSYQTVFKYETSYQYNQPVLLGDLLYDPVTTNIYYDGYFFKINIPDALTDSGLLVEFNTPSTDPIHGLINETYNVPVTDETATEFQAKVTAKSFQLISFEIEYWKANIWRVSKQFVLLK